MDHKQIIKVPTFKFYSIFIFYHLLSCQNVSETFFNKGMNFIFVVLWMCKLRRIAHKLNVVVVVRIFNATRYPRHIGAAGIAMMYMYLYSLAFMDHPCTLGAAVCHQAPPCLLYTQPRARRAWARRNNGLKIVSTWAGFEPTISSLKVECANH